MRKPGISIASHLFEETIYNRPHEPVDQESRERWARVQELQRDLCAAGSGDTVGLLAELTQAMEIYHTYEKRDAFVQGFKAGGKAMRELLDV